MVYNERRLVPSRYLDFNFIGTNRYISIYIYRSVPKVDARKGKREGEGKNNDWQITETKWRTILQQNMNKRGKTILIYTTERF